MKLTVCADLEAAAEAALLRIAAAAKEALAQRGRFTLSIDGGRPTQRLLQLLATRTGALDWPRTLVLLGDERRVPKDDPRCNQALIERLLLSGLAARPEFAAPDGSAADATQAAEAYARIWRKQAPDGVDFLLLGMGPDGHTASLFPSSPALGETERLVLPVPAPTTVEPKVARLTITPRAIREAKQVVLFAVGAEKRAAAARLLAETGTEAETPARLVLRNAHAEVLADGAAAG